MFYRLNRQVDVQIRPLRRNRHRRAHGSDFPRGKRNEIPPHGILLDSCFKRCRIHAGDFRAQKSLSQLRAAGGGFFTAKREKVNCPEQFLRVVVEDGTAYFGTDGYSCSGLAAEDYRRIYRTGEFRDIGA